MSNSNNIESILTESRSFPPPATFASLANISSEQQYQELWQQAKDEIDEVATLSRSALHDVRAAIGNYKKCSFIEQTNKLITQLHSAGLQVEHTIPEISMSAETEAALTLVATEATTNILRHSKASKACFTLKKQKNQLHFTISDNGHTNKIVEGHGLQGMRERIEKIGGDIHLNTDNGLSIEIIINERVTG